MKKGKFIVIDGTDGAGKATQTALLKAYLEKQGKQVEVADFPQYYETFFGATVGRFLAGEFGTLKQVNPYLASIIYAADRWQAKKKISKWLRDGKIVIANRYATTNMAFQTVRLPLEKQEDFLKWEEEMEYKVYKIPREDIMLFLHVPADIGFKLVQKKESRKYLNGKKKDINEKNIKYQKQVDEMYLKLLNKYKHWVKVECCNEKGKLMTPEQIHGLIVGKLAGVI